MTKASLLFSNEVFAFRHRHARENFLNHMENQRGPNLIHQIAQLYDNTTKESVKNPRITLRPRKPHHDDELTVPHTCTPPRLASCEFLEHLILPQRI